MTILPNISTFIYCFEPLMKNLHGEKKREAECKYVDFLDKHWLIIDGSPNFQRKKGMLSKTFDLQEP
ncbi:hypothetical protein DU80_14590 [Methanosarcina mazei]|uniref:Uncharacterized protein n=1 Tax=Methanosarcina mazei TaxID=2209 RepID=A0A0F8CMX5_METMZ|nr:hypothetical protein DU47_13655 [Methanosarcina mazei]KKH90529.1 hypothetical protein DU80_14590 [Methanosarcina mazei]UWJ23460.1 hypothetical protein MSMAT_2203 [Methanosarcina mazei TMA]